MPTAEFRFYEELNDFLSPERSGRSFRLEAAENATVKQAIEALGVPHTEVELILVNGVSAGFSQRIADGYRVSVYPVFEALDVTPVLRLRQAPLRRVRFLTDAHLKALAKHLRLLGFDTVHADQRSDAELAELSASQQRVLLTRDRELLKRKQVTHGCCLRQTDTEDQLVYVVQRMDLRRAARPFSRCVECNDLLLASEPGAVAQRVPAGVLEHHQRFWICRGCNRVYWRGTHYRALLRRVADALAAGG